MQKAMTQMNIQLANVISDITGVTGQAILKAIFDGERDPRELAAYRDCRIEASQEEIAQALEGNWQQDQLFLLRQEQAAYEFCQKQITESDQQLARYLAQLEDRTHGATLRKRPARDGARRRKAIHNLT
jgi:transposase